jgi:hypothetical protein
MNNDLPTSDLSVFPSSVHVARTPQLGSIKKGLVGD